MNKKVVRELVQNSKGHLLNFRLVCLCPTYKRKLHFQPFQDWPPFSLSGFAGFFLSNDSSLSVILAKV